MPGSRRSEHGSITAEFAAVVPAVILVLACCLGGLQVAGQQLRLQDAAASAARSLARGGSIGAASTLAARLVTGATLARDTRGGMVCAHLSAPAGLAGGLVGAVTVTATSCALAGDE